MLKNCGHIDAEHIEEYIACGGYQAFAKALFDMKPEEVVQRSWIPIKRPRGGGFQTGYKWKQVAGQKEKIRYVVCNGDEGDPGAFMDRSIMEGDPHKMIEGMMIAAYAVSAQEGYIYVRAEYPLAISRLKLAIRQAEEKGLLGDHILERIFHFIYILTVSRRICLRRRKRAHGVHRGKTGHAEGKTAADGGTGSFRKADGS